MLKNILDVPLSIAQSWQSSRKNTQKLSFVSTHEERDSSEEEKEAPSPAERYALPLAISTSTSALHQIPTADPPHLPPASTTCWLANGRTDLHCLCIPGPCMALLNVAPTRPIAFLFKTTMGEHKHASTS